MTTIDTPHSFWTWVGLVLLAIPIGMHAQSQPVPNLISYQGRIAIGSANFNGSGQFRFALVSTTGSTTYWSNDGSSTAGSQPATAVTLSVIKGLYSVLLGDTTLGNMTTLPASVFNNSDVRLRVWFDDGVNGVQQLTPDQRIAAVGYAMVAANVPDGAITSAKIASGAIGSAQLASGITITGTLTGNASTATTAGTFTGTLAGDVTGTESSTVVASVGSSSASNIHSAELAANAATSANTASTIVKRDASGNFSTGTITLNAILNLPTTSSASIGVIRQNGGSLLHSFGTGSFFSGPGAGNFTLTGANNTGLGNSSLFSVTTGTDNTSVGLLALGLTTTGNGNTAIGRQALYTNTGGSDDTAVGKGALLNNTANSGTAVGAGALTANTTGSSNTALGANALSVNTAGSNNIAVGFQSGNLLTTGSNNIDIGNQGVAAESNIIRIGDGVTQTDTFLTGIVHGNGSGLTGVTVANGSINSTKLASGLTLSGTTAGAFSGPLTGNVTGNVSGSAATFTGTLTGDVTGTEGSTVVASVGGSAAGNVHSAELAANAATSGDIASTLVKRDGSGSFIVQVITANGGLNLTTTSNSSVGVITQNGSSLIHTFGTGNFFAGSGAGNFTLTGLDNTATGVGVLAATTIGTGNTAIGTHALVSNTEGASNTAIGTDALHSNIGVGNSQTGYYNVAIGSESLFSNSQGVGNTAVGVQALQNLNGSSNLCSNNIALGYGAGTNLTTGFNNIDIGNNGVAGESQIIRIGTAGQQTDTYLTGTVHGTFNGDGSGLTNLPASARGAYAITANSTGAAFTTASATPVAVTNMSLSLSTTGRAVQVCLITNSNVEGSAASVGINGAPGTEATISLWRDGVEVGVVFLLSVGNTMYVPPGSVQYFDAAPAGTHTYQLKASYGAGGGGSVMLYNCSMLAHEL